VTVDAASRVAVAVVVAVDTAPGAVAGTVHPVDVPAIADLATTAGHYWTIDGPLAVDAAVLIRPFADSVAFAQPSAVVSAAEESGPAGLSILALASFSLALLLLLLKLALLLRLLLLSLGSFSLALLSLLLKLALLLLSWLRLLLLPLLSSFSFLLVLLLLLLSLLLSLLFAFLLLLALLVSFLRARLDARPEE
jgi:hypothetical protein